MTGKKEWIIPDGFMSDTVCGDYVSHEAVCALNLTDSDAHIDLTIFFEDRPPMTGIRAVCGAQRTHHIRLDKLIGDNGTVIPRNVPYAVRMVSDQPIIVQHSRMDVSQPAMTLMTTIAYGE